MDIIAFVDGILRDAVDRKASDIHFEPFEDALVVRARVEGDLSEVCRRPPQLTPAVLSRLKVMAGLDISERRLPQDGRFGLATGDGTVDLRVATIPTQFGESIVLRVLDPRSPRASLAALGMPGPVLGAMRRAIARPDGLILATGPTGSGKTTTLYAALRELNRADLKILTIEDPIEYRIDGVTQVGVNLASGLTFAAALRGFLRQDPDVIMVGEIRDEETARTAVQASLTGHLVLATLHTNDAPEAIARLVNMGVERHLLATSLQLVVAQRLVRTDPGVAGRDCRFDLLEVDDAVRDRIGSGV